MSSFAELEVGREGRPVDLYQFTFGAEIFRFTNVKSTVVFSGANYLPIPIKRSSPTLNPRERKNTTVTLEVPADIRPFTEFIGIQPALRLDLIITRVQLDETVSSPEFSSPEPVKGPLTGFVLFSGYVSSHTFAGRIATVTLSPFTEQFTREIPRFKYQSLCNHVLYDTQCTINKNLFSQSGIVTAKDGNTIQVNGLTGTAFTGGYIENSLQTDFRMIIVQATEVFTLLLPFAGVELGETVTCYQGCDHSVATCKAKFNNVENYGGFPLIPGVNPFEQSAFVKN